MFGRKSRRELAAEVAEQRERLRAFEAAQRGPLWRRILRRAHAMPGLLWVPAVVVAVAGVAVAATTVVTARATRWGWWAWLTYPRPATAALATGWVVAGGPGGWWWGVLPLSLTTAAAAWWHHRGTPATPGRGPVVDGRVALWRQQVAAGDDAPARGSRVADHVTIVRAPDGRPCGAVLHVTGADSTQHPGHMVKIADRLAYIYAVDRAAVTVRPVKGNNRRSDVEILDQWWMDEQAAARTARIHDVQPWTGPSLEPDGRFRVMTAERDGAPVYARLWTPGYGAHDTDLSGVKGSGKSNAANLILASVMSAGVVVLDLVDLKGGTSLSKWRPLSYRFGSTVEDGLLALDRALAVAEARMAQYARTPVLDADGAPVVVHGQPLVGVEQVDPSEAFPVYLLVVDEFPRLIARKEAERKLKVLVNIGRSLNVAVALIHQSASRGDGWGEAIGVRTNITKSGNVLGFRNDAQSGAKTVGGDARLQDIPEGTPGAGFVSSPCTRGEVFGRVEFVEDVVAAVRGCRPGRLELAAEVAVAEVEAWAEETCRRRDAGYVQRWAEHHVAMTAGATAGVGVSGVVGSVPPMPSQQPQQPSVDPAASERIEAFLREQGPGQVFTTGTLLKAADVYSSTFTAWRQRQPDGVLVDHGRGKWAAGPAVLTTTAGSRA